MVLTRRFFKVEDDGGAHIGGLAVGRFEQIGTKPGGRRGGQPRLLFQLTTGRFKQVFPRLHMASGLVEAALAFYLLFHHQKAPLPLHQGGDRQARLHAGVAGGRLLCLIAHHDSLSLLLGLSARAGRRAVPRPLLRGLPPVGFVAARSVG